MAKQERISITILEIVCALSLFNAKNTSKNCKTVAYNFQSFCQDSFGLYKTTWVLSMRDIQTVMKTRVGLI